jgi:ribosomal protein L7/L12
LTGKEDTMQDLLNALIVIVVAIAVLGWAISVLRKRQRNQMDYPQGLRSDADPNSGTDEIRRMALAGNKIEAIKRYREIHGVGLKEAKDAVEKLLGE